jgi:hypothetical protein
MPISLSRSALIVCALTVVAATDAAAQTRPQPAPRPTAAAKRTGPPRFHVTIGGGAQVTTTEFDDTFTFQLHQETGSSRVDYPIESGFLFDIGGGVRLTRQFGVGVAVSHFAASGTVAASSSLPHPFFFQQPREISGEDDGVERTETGVHIQAQYLLPLRGKLQVMLMGGPSILQVNQDIVNEVNYREEYPFDTATFVDVDTERAKSSATGFHVGADVRWMFSRQVGAGVLLRFTRATVELDAPGNRTIEVDAGGAHVAAGLRIVF